MASTQTPPHIAVNFYDGALKKTYTYYDNAQHDYMREENGKWVYKRQDEDMARSPTSSRNYTRRSRKENFFQPGRIFQCCWNEEAGGNAVPNAAFLSFNTQGGTVYSKYRYFVVFSNNGNDSSQCFRLETYGGKGVAKDGVVKNDHVMINTDDGQYGQTARLLPGEQPGIGESGIRRVIRHSVRRPGDRLDPKSRINLKMQYPIQHNVRVYDMGWVHQDDLATLHTEWLAVHGLTPVS